MTLHDIASAVERATGYDLSALRSRNRRAGIAAARQVFCYISVRDQGWECAATGRFVERDRASVSVAARAAQRLLETGDRLIMSTYDHVVGELKVEN